MDEPTQYRIADAEITATAAAGSSDNRSPWQHADGRPPLALRRPVAVPAGADQDAERMARYGISAETKTVYGFEGHVYDRLDDAVAYAAIQKARRSAEPPAAPLATR